MRALSIGLVALTLATTVPCTAGAQRRALEGSGRRRYHRVQHGHCSYTFVLPEADPLPCPGPPGPANVLLQRDSPASTAVTSRGATQRLRHLERILENSTQWLLKVGCRAGGDRGLPQHPSVQHPRTRFPLQLCLLWAPGGRAECRGVCALPGSSTAARLRVLCRFASRT